MAHHCAAGPHVCWGRSVGGPQCARVVAFPPWGRALGLGKTQRFLQALHHIVDDRAGFSVVDDLPEAGAKVSMQMGIIGADGWPHLVDRTEVAIEKRAGEGLR